MDKKEVYEHLAKIYLDASQKHKRKRKTKKHLGFKNLFFLGIAFVFGCSIFFLSTRQQNKALKSEIALLLQSDSVKINFHFDPARKEIYALNLNKLNLSRFKVLAFSVKKSNYQDTISLRVEFTNAFKEKSEVYLKNVPHKWQDYKIPLAAFKNISDWSEMLSLAFIVEEWNARKKNDVVYLDNIGLLR